MNKERRKSINDIITKLDEIEGLINTVRDEEQASLNNLADNLQKSNPAKRMKEAIDGLKYAKILISATRGNLRKVQNG